MKIVLVHTPAFLTPILKKLMDFSQRKKKQI